MRKTWIIACAAAAAVFAGCNREFDAPVPGDGFLRATIETPSRVSFTDEGVFSWQAGDAIAVSTNAGFKTFTLQSGEGAASGVFDGDLGGVTAATVAVYPAAVAKDDATVTLPAEYAWAEGQSNAVMFCDKVSLTEVNSFKHLGGILKIAYAGIPADADALVLKAEAKITGDFTIADGVIAAGAGTDEVKVTFAAGSNPAAFYIPVPTGEYKFSVELQKAGAAIEGTQKATTNAVKIARKSLILMDPIAGPDTPELKTEIATAEDFLSFVENAKLYAATDEVKLTADITLPETFAPDTLWCNFNGQGHKVTYTLDIPKESTRSAGLFTNIQDGLTVKNLKVAGSLKSAKVSTGGIGGKVGANVTFENCESAVNILCNVAGVTYHLGGIAGDIATGSVFRGCHNSGNVIYALAELAAGKNSQVGGIVGQANGVMLFEDCVNDGNVEFHAGDNGPRMAGICGYVNDVTDASFIRCTNNGEVLSEWKRSGGYAYKGGITGYYGSPVAGCKVVYSECVNNGKLSSFGNTNIRCRIGGIAAYAGMTDDNATNQGVSESGTDWKYTNCTNNGEISNIGTNSANHIGGIVGFSERAAKLIIEGCTQNSKISQAGAGRAGGMLGMRGGSQSIYKDIKVTKNVLLEVTGAGDAKLIIGDNDTQIVTEMTGKIEAATVSVNGTATEMTADNYRDFLLKNALGEGGSTEGVVFDGGQPSYPAPMEKISEGAQLDPTTLPGDWNVLGNNSTKNGIYVLGGTGSDPRLVCPYDKTWDWNDSIYRESDNGLTIEMTGISGTSIQGNMNWWAGADGKFWDYVWNFSSADKPEYIPYIGTDLSQFYNKLPKGKNAVSIDIMTFTATLSNGETPKILTPGVYKFCEGGSGQTLTVPDGCFALKFHLGNMQVQAGEWYGKDIDRFMFCPLEYIIIFEKEGGSVDPGEQGEAAPMELMTPGAALDISTLAGSWNVLGNNSTKNGIYVLGGSGSDPRLVCPYDKTWDWNDSVYRESDNGLSIAVTSMEGTSVTGTINWWSGADGKFWDYVWNFKSSADPTTYDPYMGTDLSKFYNKIPKGKYAFTLDLATMTATLNNGEKPKILTPGVYKICDGDGNSQKLTVPDGCFAMKFHLGNMHKEQNGAFYGKDIDRFMFYPLEYFIIFEKE